jgi:hypothetical protein
VSQEVRQFFDTEMTGKTPYLISGDFDGNRKPDYAALIRSGHTRDRKSKRTWPRYFLVAFLRDGRSYRMYVMSNPDGEYLCLVQKGTAAYNYDEQKEITYANDAILAGVLEKGGSSYVFEKGRFRSFVSSD